MGNGKCDGKAETVQEFPSPLHVSHHTLHAARFTSHVSRPAHRNTTPCGFWRGCGGKFQAATFGGKLQAEAAAQNLTEHRLLFPPCNQCHRKDAGCVDRVMLKFRAQPVGPAPQCLEHAVLIRATQNQSQFTRHMQVKRCHPRPFRLNSTGPHMPPAHGKKPSSGPRRRRRSLLHLLVSNRTRNGYASCNVVSMAGTGPPLISGTR